MSVTDEQYDPDEHEPLPEGEEEPPPFLHTMAIVRWALFAGMSIFALVMVLTAFGLTPWAAGEGGAAQYHCPMHPTYISNQPGDCPICGMSLVPISDENSSAGTDTSHAAHTMAKPGQYTCPMHPEVVSDAAGRCPECNMFLEKVPEAGEDDMGAMGSAPVPGLVPLTIEPQRLQLIGVRTARVVRRSADGELRLVGFVTPDETRVANLHVRVNGWVSKLFVDQTGQPVQAGELLLSLYSQDLYQAEQDLTLARKAASKPDTDPALTAMREQILSAARERLHLLGLSDDEIATLEKSDLPSQELALRSPFAGYVLEKSVYEGQYIGPDQNLFTIADLRSVWVLADVYERDLPYVRLGQTVQTRLTSFPGEVFKGRIGFIYPSVSEKTRTLKVRLEFANPSLQLRPGMYADVSVGRGGDDMLAVPSEAVMDGGETKYAFVVHDQTHFEPRLLKTGRVSDDWIEILEGLSEGEEVVTSANFLIDSESRLKAAISGMGGVQVGAHEGHGQ